MNVDLSRHMPPGVDDGPLVKTFYAGIILSALFSFGFVFKLIAAYNSLFDYSGDKRILITQLEMPQFFQLLGSNMLGFVILSLGLCGFIVYYYAYHYQDSKSIFLMRRIPDRFELHRRCWTAPLLFSALSLGSAAVLTLIYYVVYLLVTPKECLPVQFWQSIWSDIK